MSPENVRAAKPSCVSLGWSGSNSTFSDPALCWRSPQPSLGDGHIDRGDAVRWWAACWMQAQKGGNRWLVKARSLAPPGGLPRGGGTT